MAADESVEAIGEITGVIAQIDDVSRSISSSVDEHTASTREIAVSVQQASQGTEEARSRILAVNEATARTGATARSVHVAADDLAEQGGALRQAVDSFLAKVRVA